jgi:hypothetical protein
LTVRIHLFADETLEGEDEADEERGHHHDDVHRASSQPLTESAGMRWYYALGHQLVDVQRAAA